MANITCTKKLIFQCILLVLVLGITIYLYETRYSSAYKSVAIINVVNTDTESQEITATKLAIKPRKKGGDNKWIVVTTITSPSKDIEKLTKIKGWKVLVVGDLKTPTNWSFPGCIFLGIDQQKDLGFQSAKYLPTNSYTRKNIGYLYAIQHGAQYIYDTDDDNHPTNGKINFHLEEFTRGLIYDDFTKNVMNPYAHFGQPTIWPRGYPLDFIDKPNINTYKLCKLKTPAIQQGLVNGDPDLDAIFRLTRKLPNQQNINITFDPRAPPVILPEGVFAPFNSQNTFFTYDAFWALFLPTSVAFRVTDIWRGYWAQKLLWLLGHRLSFFPPNAVQFRNSHDYLKDFEDEGQFYLQTDSLIEFLKDWSCTEITFFKCVSQLSHDMVAEKFWDKKDAQLIDHWLSDLTSIGYTEPQMIIEESECVPESNITQTNTVYFSPVLQSDQRQESGLDDICGFCQNYLNVSDMEIPSKPKTPFEDILLIIIFNFPIYKNIRMLDALYYDHFPNMVYCGQSVSYQSFQAEITQGPFYWRKREVSFINITTDKGYFTYECAIRAMQMNYDVNGYLVMGDDVLFNFWNLNNLKQAQLEVPSHRTMLRSLSTNETSWPWWKRAVGKEVTEEALTELESLAKNSKNKQQKNLLQKFIQTRTKANMNMTLLSIGVSDLYYVPQSLSATFVEVMRLFFKHKVFLEIAIPTTIVGLSPSATKEGFVGKSLWYGGERNYPLKYYNSTTHYIHPVKFSSLFKNESDLQKEYCQNYVMHLIKNW